ncbi:MAG: WD40 repeat domain-containing protein [Candidatus Tectimicrobiota bacterium]
MSYLYLHAKSVLVRYLLLLGCLYCFCLSPVRAAPSLPPLLPEGESWPEITQLLAQIPTQPHVRALRFSPDGRSLLAVDGAGTVRWWDVRSGHTFRQFALETPPRAVSVSADGQWLVLGASAGRIALWDLEAGRALRHFQAGQHDVQAVSLSPDTRLLAAEAGSLENAVAVWDLATGEQRYRLTGHRTIPSVLSFSPDSRLLASADMDGSVRLWDMASGRVRHRLSAPEGVQAMHFSADGTCLAAGGGGAVVIWEIATGKVRQQLKGHSGGVQALGFSPDGASLAVAVWDPSRTVWLWDIASGSAILRLSGAPERASLPRSLNEKETLHFSPNGATLAAWAGDGTVRLWDLASGQERQRLGGQSSALKALQVSPDGQSIASAGEDGVVRLWDAASGQERQRLTGAWDAVQVLRFRPDGRTLALGTSAGQVWLLDLASGQAASALTGHTGAVTSLSFSPDGQLLASGAERDEAVRVWDVAVGQEVRRLAEPATRVQALSFSPDGAHLVVGDSTGLVLLWDLRTAQVLRQFMTARHGVQALLWHPDGAWLAVSHDYEPGIGFWDLASGRERQRLTTDASGVRLLHLTPDGRTLRAVARNGTVQVWDMASGQEQERLEESLGWVDEVDISPAGHLLVASAGFGAIQVVRGTPWRFAWLALGGRAGNWLTYQAYGQGWRADDGMFMHQLDAPGRLTPLLPPAPAGPAQLEIRLPDVPLVVEDGEAAAFRISVHNRAASRVYWLQVIQDTARTPETSLLLHAPASVMLLEPDELVHLTGKVSAPTERVHPQEREAVLHMQLTTAHGAPLALELPVTVRVPSLQWREASQSADRGLWSVVLHNAGQRDLAHLSFTLTQAGTTLRHLQQPLIRRDETVRLTFALPVRLLQREVEVTLTAMTRSHPLHLWHFPGQRLSLPGLPWQFPVLGLALLLGVTLGWYGRSRWRAARRRS